MPTSKPAPICRQTLNQSLAHLRPPALFRSAARFRSNCGTDSAHVSSPKLRSGTDVRIGIDLSVTVTTDQAPSLEKDIRQSLDDLGLGGNVKVD